MSDVKNKSNLFLKIAPFVSLAAMIVYVIGVFTSAELSRVWIANLMFTLPVLVASFIMVKAYVDHNKNLMKSLIGFVLVGVLMLSIHYAFWNFDITNWYCVVKASLFVLIAIFTFNQFLLSNDHYSLPVILFINQIVMDILLVISIVATVFDVLEWHDNPMVFISLLVFVLSSMFIVLVIEMKVNDFKVKREAKGYVFVKSQTSDDVLEEEDMFIANGLFYSLPWFVLVGLLGLIGFNALFDKVITWGYSVRYLFYIIKIVCLFALIRTYKTHNKNVMKIMLGFLLGFLLFENLFEVACLSVDTFKKITIEDIKPLTTLAMVVVNVFFLVAHLILTATHASHPKTVKAMKIAYVVYSVFTLLVAIGCTVCYILVPGDNHYFFAFFKPLLWIFGTFPVITAILTIDTRVNGFKVRRELK